MAELGWRRSLSWPLEVDAILAEKGVGVRREGGEREEDWVGLDEW